MTDARQPTAVLLDVDGTLVDSNYAHVNAWERAFREEGHPVPGWRVHRSIGMDPRLLIEQLAGGCTDLIAQAVADRHSIHYACEALGVLALPGAARLVRTIAARGARPVLATSAEPDELSRLLDLLDVSDALYAVTSAGDVDQAKPATDLIQAALDAAGVAPDQAILVGDTVWDVQAAARAGVGCVGVRSGGIGVQELRDAGALAVYDDAAAILDGLDASPLARLLS
ncbi:MAG: HAD family hydrolase [Cellulomonadaceae bacterium]